MKRLIAVLFLVGILGGAAYYNYHATHAPSPSALSPSQNGATEPTPVTVATARRHSTRDSLTVVGVLRADLQASVSAKIPSRILSILVKEGARVRRGQPLVRLDVSDSKSQILGAQAGVDAARAQYHKALDGKRARAVEMDTRISEAEGGLRTAKARLHQAELGSTLAGSSTGSDADKAAAAVQQAEEGVNQAKLSRDQAEKTLSRLEFLYSKGGVPRVDVEGARTQAEIARSQYVSAAAGLSQAKAAAKPAADAVPLRTQVSQADIDAANSGVRQATEGVANARRAKTEALRIADRDIEAALAAVRQAEAGETQVSTQAGNGVLVSPLDGVVSDLTAHSGEVAQPGQPLLTVVSPGSVYLEASAPARYASSIKPGQPAHVTVDTLPNSPLDGEVTEVLRVAASDSRSLPLRIRLENRNIKLAPGVAAKAEIELSHDPNAVTIPVDAIRNEGNVNFVYVVVNGVAQRHNVMLGAMEGQIAQVLSGVSAGDVVVVSGPASLQSGMPVRVVGH